MTLAYASCRIRLSLFRTRRRRTLSSVTRNSNRYLAVDSAGPGDFEPEKDSVSNLKSAATPRRLPRYSLARRTVTVTEVTVTVIASAVTVTVPA